MTKPTRALLATLAAGVVLLPFAGATALTTDRVSAKPDAFQQPKAGSWSLDDPFGEEKGGFKVKAGKNGKAPKVTKLHIDVLEQASGSTCSAAGARVDVKGSFKLYKAIKYAGTYYDSAWIATKDKKYDDDFPNLQGMKPVSVKVQIGSEARSGQLAMYFAQPNPSKPHEMNVLLRVFPPGVSTTDEGWCLYELDGKPGK